MFMNDGVKLVTEGSRILDDLRSLQNQGISILACGPCLGYCDLTQSIAIGKISNLFDIASRLLGAGKIVNL